VVKKFFIFILVIVIALILTFFIWGFIKDFSPSPISSLTNPPKPDAAHAPVVINNGTRYFTLNGEFSIILPREYQVSTQYGIPGKQIMPPEAGAQIFIATSSDTLIDIRNLRSSYSKDFTQKEAVDTLSKFGESLNINNFTGESFGSVTEVRLGSNYYGVRVGTAPETRSDNGQPITRNIRQYITYYNQASYIIEFVDYAPNSINDSSSDQIVSTINFN